MITEKIIISNLYKLRAGEDYRQISLTILKELESRGLVKLVWVDELSHPAFCKINRYGLRYLNYLEQKATPISN